MTHSLSFPFPVESHQELRYLIPSHAFFHHAFTLVREQVPRTPFVRMYKSQPGGNDGKKSGPDGG